MIASHREEIKMKKTSKNEDPQLIDCFFTFLFVLCFICIIRKYIKKWELEIYL